MIFFKKSYTKYKYFLPKTQFQIQKHTCPQVTKNVLLAFTHFMVMTFALPHLPAITPQSSCCHFTHCQPQDCVSEKSQTWL